MNTKHLPLIIAIALPIVFIITLALIVFIPSSRLNPEHDFLYIDQSEQYSYSGMVQYQNRYEIQGTGLIQVPVGTESMQRIKQEGFEHKDAPTLYYYDVQNNNTRQISFDEAQEFLYEAGPSSPDGFVFERDYGSDGIFDLFGSNQGQKYYIRKGSGKKELTGFSSDNVRNYGRDIVFIGWIK